MKIQMQIVLSQSEIEDAIRDYVRIQAPMAVGEDVTIELVDDDQDKTLINAIVTVGGAGLIEEKPKPVKATRTKKAAAVTETVAAEETETSQEDVTEEVADEDPVETTDVATETVEENTPGAADPVPEKKNGLQIFANAESSAPPAQKVDEPVVAAKSLFANLTKPTNHH